MGHSSNTVQQRRKSPGTTRSLTIEGGDPNVPGVGRSIPVPDIPLGPILSLSAFLPRGPATIPSILDNGAALMVTTGRVATALALEALGIGRGDKVLIPAYHCSTMVSPLAWVGAEPEFYRIAGDLSVDLGDVSRRLGPHVRALVVAHFFGFPQDTPAARKLCEERGLFLIEDCAHCFYGRVHGRPVGAFGDYAIGSQRKFFPIGDGGCLVSATRPVVSRPLHDQPWTAEAFAAYRLIDRAIDYGRMPALRPLRAAAKSLAGAMRPAAGSGSRAGDASDSSVGTQFDGDVTHRMAALSRWLAGAVSANRVIARRRENYHQLVEGLSGIAGCRPLCPTLAPDVVPYMFPVWIDELPRVFPRLEDAALPMQRFGQFLWPSMNRNACPVAAEFSRHVVQFACHQDLSPCDIEEMVGRIRRALGLTSGVSLQAMAR
jgi:dTDP-4-amino-4,6-dideoxygalactose transaminase